MEEGKGRREGEEGEGGKVSQSLCIITSALKLDECYCLETHPDIWEDNFNIVFGVLGYCSLSTFTDSYM